jgi:methyltransferase (TIGR00027 family)
MQASRTALAAATLRAYHHLCDPEPKLLDDPIAHRIVDRADLQNMENEPERFAEPMSLALRLHVLLRSRYAEDELAAAFASGVRQLVILGAGFDTFPYRQPEWASDLQIFEVDQPATQTEKRRRLAEASVPVASNVRYVPLDFERSDLRAELVRAGLDETRPAFFSWLGVTAYLSKSAIEAVFADVAALGPGSEIAFDFADGQTPASLAETVRDLGEPWITRYECADLERALRAAGFSTVAFLTPELARERFALAGLKSFSPSERTSIGKATV